MLTARPNPMTSESDGTLEERRYFCQNWRADVVAVTKPDGTPLEYVRYSSYGEPTVYPVADLNMDGVVNSTDVTEWSNLVYGSPSSAVYADSDLDWDGADDWNSGGADGDLFTESYNANTGLSGVGRVSSAGVASRVGYAGYQWDGTLAAYHVRYRVYLPDIGRWTRRDPLGYVDGMGLYQYLQARAIAAADPTGLWPEESPLKRGLPRTGPRTRQWECCLRTCGVGACWAADRMATRIQQRLRAEFGGPCSDDWCDALRHCVWSCERQASLADASCARKIANCHEWGHPNTPAAHDMDYYNNAVGRAIGRGWRSNPAANAACWGDCKAALLLGVLMNKPGEVMVPPSRARASAAASVIGCRSAAGGTSP